jgi:hypothetical protein
MEYAVIAIIGLGVLVFVSRPLFGRERRLYEIESAFESGDAGRLNHLNIKRARIEENLRELEFEHEMGKLSDEDYAALRGGYTKENEDVEKSLASLKVRANVEKLIESEVRSRRRIK